MAQTGNRAYGLAGVERKQKRRLLKRANKRLPSLARRRQAKERAKARQLRRRLIREHKTNADADRPEPAAAASPELRRR